MSGLSHEEVEQVLTRARERAVRKEQEHRGEYPSLWAAIESIAPKIGCVPQTLNEWVKRDEVDSGARAGTTTSEHESAGAQSPGTAPSQRDPEAGERLFCQAELDRRLTS